MRELTFEEFSQVAGGEPGERTADAASALLAETPNTALAVGLIGLGATGPVGAAFSAAVSLVVATSADFGGNSFVCEP